MKRFLTAMLLALTVLWALPACGGVGEVIDYSLVFVNDSDAAIVEVVADFNDQTSGARNANSSPLKRGETFGFELGEYPVTLTVYDRLFEDFGQKKLASITINGAPPEGERWYVTARDGTGGLVLSADTQWPGGVVGYGGLFVGLFGGPRPGGTAAVPGPVGPLLDGAVIDAG